MTYYSRHQVFRVPHLRPAALLLRDVRRMAAYALDADGEANMIDACITLHVMGAKAAAAYREAQLRDERIMRLAHRNGRISELHSVTPEEQKS